MDLTLADFVWFVLLGSSGLVVLLAVVSRSLHARSEARSQENRVICRLCLHAFEDHSHERIVNCPQCGAANEKGRSRRLG
jgi:Zn finger protein HypA/HybF involved in hydrogenase expression